MAEIERRPVDVTAIAPEDLVLVADVAAYYARIVRVTRRGFKVQPLDQLDVVRPVPRSAIYDHWHRAERLPAVAAAQLRIEMGEGR